MIRHSNALALALLLPLAACGDDGTQMPDAGQTPDAGAPDASGETIVPDTYTFESRFISGESSVSYSGQVLRQVLIAELTNHIEGLTEKLDNGTFTPMAGQVEQSLDFYYRFDGTDLTEPLTITTTPALSQTTYDGLGAVKNLQSKLAGNDSDAAEVQHEDWTTAFVGWDTADAQSPDGLIRYWFGLLDSLAVDRVGSPPLPQDPDGQAITKVYVTAEGQDLEQLIQKFLLGAVAFSQATDDYLDDATAGKGLDVSNAQDGEKPYSALEHHWDEAFGYFGAARDYGDYTDEDIASPGYRDSDENQEIDLQAEYNFSYAVDAAKRDLGSNAAAPTDFSNIIFDAYVQGRAIISAGGDPLTKTERTALLAQRDIIVQTWEQVIGANVVHHINETLRDTIAIGTDQYDFYDHAKHWSEMKGFALGLQFNPASPLEDAKFAELHQLIGDAPVLPGAAAADLDAYQANLLQARDIIQQAYGFDDANVGDDTGNGGW